MKSNERKILLILACMVFYLLAGCGAVTEKSEQAFDDEKQFLLMYNYPESDKGIYYIEWDLEKPYDTLYFVDKKTAKKTVLCQDLNCKHDSEKCQAVTMEPGTMGCAVYSDGMIYYMVYNRKNDSALELYSMKEDGTNKRLEHTFENAEIYPNSGALYKGKIFLSVQTMETDEESGTSFSAEPSILVYDLETKKEEIVIDGRENKGNYVVPCGGSRNGVYLAQIPWNSEEEDPPLKILEYDLETKELSDIYETTWVNWQEVNDDSMYIQSRGKKQLEKYHLKTKESSLVLEWEDEADSVEVIGDLLMFLKETEEDGVFKEYGNWYDLSEGKYLFNEYQDLEEVYVKRKMEKGYWTVKNGEIHFYYLEGRRWEKVEDI